MKVTTEGPQRPLLTSQESTSTGTSDDLEWPTGPTTTVLALDDLTDVDVSGGKTDGDTVRWDSSAGKWIPGPVSTGRWAPMTIDPSGDGAWELLFTDDGDVFMMEVFD